MHVRGPVSILYMVSSQNHNSAWKAPKMSLPTQSLRPGGAVRGSEDCILESQ